MIQLLGYNEDDFGHGGKWNLLDGFMIALEGIGKDLCLGGVSAKRLHASHRNVEPT